ncbi:FtsH protease activity modulator HflK [Janthinobacterium agaricidamnosum]|uniref:Protein HflK n=1 Tax=Janthinobacterium agaricidamnosum NBRC 102515 = DSM 9628 TaxID=1349767 RepID=W0V5G8_9BURK|nr:FtsH protease activity modulator HflK [Janthinobacterium agaricidamnosum]CDG84069.1 hflK protein [Janthinobacterium agaricidamnosum NBRC 102515 = DSM 9628]
MLVNLNKKLGLKLSLNDPRWGNRKDDGKKAQEGKKPGEGPPDLDQLWRDFNQRLNAFFGQKNRPDNGGGAGGGGQRPDMKGAGITAGVVGGIAVLIWLASGAFIVQEGQSGVVLTFGKYSHTTPSGFNWRLPYPIQSNEIVNVSQVRTVEVGYRSTLKNKQAGESLMLTDDENIIDIQFAVQYTLKDPVAWLFNNRDAEESLRQVAETAIREIVGRSKMDFVLYEGREKVAFDTQQLMQHVLDRYAVGAQITNVTMQAVQPPEQVQSAFDDAVKAGQDRERQKNEGQAYANDVIPKARGAAFRLIQEAEAYRSLVTENAEGNASRFQQVLVEYQKAPAVTRDRMYLETMQQVFSSASKVMVDAKNGSNLLYLPLDKLISQAAAGDATAAAARAAASAAAAPQPPVNAVLPQEVVIEGSRSRSRDSSRERESR